MFKINVMALDVINGRMEDDIQETLSKIYDRAKGNIFGPMVPCMWENFIWDNDMDVASIPSQMVDRIKEIS
jgi:hypothetical protein